MGSRRVFTRFAPFAWLALAACGDDTDATTAAGGGGDDATASAGSGASNGGSGGNTSSSGATTTGSAAGGGGSGGGTTVDPLANAPLAEGVRLDAVTVLQSTSVPIVTAGAAVSSDLPLVAGRDAWFRGFPQVEGASSSIRLEVLVQRPGEPIEVFRSEETLATNGDPDDPSTTPICHVPAAAFVEGARWAARLVTEGASEVAAGVAHDARFPREGSLADLGAQVVPALQLTLVPLRWDADGSGRLPDTSPAALDVYRAHFIAHFPIAEVAFSVHEAVPYDRGLDFFGDVDFGDVNDLLYDLREAEAAPFDAHYYGLVKPADSFDDYCFGSCVTGQSWVPDASEADLRVGAGVAFDPESGAGTAAHEVGHLFGRYHAPCDVSQGDDEYPYEDGALGVLGWDPRVATPLDPWLTYDFMGYCDPQGVSDYTFAALFERHQLVAQLTSVAPIAPPPARRPGPPPAITCTTTR